MAETVDARLAQRRITSATMEAFGIQAMQYRWEYPVNPGGPVQRWKNFEDNRFGKYGWIGHKPNHSFLYFGRDFYAAVEQTGGRAWLVSGEADCWAADSARIHHVFAVGFGEGNLPDNLGYVLADLHITDLCIAPDRDKTGMAWARRIMDILLESQVNVRFRAFELPFPLTKSHGGDLGNSWQTYATVEMNFEDWLLSLSPLDCSQIVSHSTIAKPKQSSPVFSNIDPDYIAMVTAALETDARQIKESGFSKLIHCPNPAHSDNRPSANLHEVLGVRCFICGWHKWTDLGDWLGVGSLGEFYKNHQAANHPLQLANETREALIQRGLSRFSRFLDILYRQGHQPGMSFSLADAVRFCDGYLNEAAIRRLLTMKTGKVEDPRQKIISQILNDAVNFLFQHEHSSETANKSKGRPKNLFVVPDPIGIAKYLHVERLHFTPLADVFLREDAAYRNEVIGIFSDRNPGQMSRKLRADLFGISKTLSIEIDKMNCTPIQQFIIRTPLNLQTSWRLPQRREKNSDFACCYIQTQSCERYPAVRGVYYYLTRFKAGVNAWVMKRQANIYFPRNHTSPLDPLIEELKVSDFFSRVQINRKNQEEEDNEMQQIIDILAAGMPEIPF